MYRIPISRVVFIAVAFNSGNVMSAAAPSAEATFNGANYIKEWHSIQKRTIQVSLDSKVSIAVNTGGAVIEFGLEGQMAVGYWKKAEAHTLPHDNGFRISGINKSDVPIEQTVTVAEDVVTCVYRAGSPFTLSGTFLALPQVNWFRSIGKNGAEIQGELWGEYRNLELYEPVEYTYQERRIRLAFPSKLPMVLQRAPSVYEPAQFRLPACRSNGVYEVELMIHSLNPAAAPSANPNSPVVTRRFNREKFITEPIESLSRHGFHPDLRAKEKQIFPTQVRFTPQKGHPAIFKRNERLTFCYSAVTDKQRNQPVSPLEIRCVDAMNDAAVQAIPLNSRNGISGKVELKSVKPGPYRIELWQGRIKVGEEEFVVVGPVDQRKVSPFAKELYRLKEVDRIECAADNGRHEFYCISPDKVKIGETPGVGQYLEDSAAHGSGFAPQGLEWLAYRVNHLAVDKPHLLTVEYPDIDDMLVSVEMVRLRCWETSPQATRLTQN